MKIKALFLSGCHSFYHSILSVFFNENTNHYIYHVTEDTYFCGIKIWERIDKIGCTCGKIWYEKL